MTERAAPPSIDDFAWRLALQTRWNDNDSYGHVNNVVYYEFFDTAVNAWLIRRGVLDIAASPVVGLVVESGCRYLLPIGFPDVVEAGLRVVHLGNSSVRYEIGLFRNDETTAAAVGYFVHVYVDRQTNRPVPIPAPVRAVLQELVKA